MESSNGSEWVVADSCGRAWAEESEEARLLADLQRAVKEREETWRLWFEMVAV